MTDGPADDVRGGRSDQTPLSSRLAVGWAQFLARWDRLGTSIDRTVSHSKTGGLLGRVGARWRTLVTGSSISRWLTHSPDQQVIVIDLGRTWTVGPVLEGVDRLARTLAVPWRASGAQSVVASARTLGARVTDHCTTVLETSTVNRWVTALVTPPGDADSPDRTR